MLTTVPAERKGPAYGVLPVPLLPVFVSAPQAARSAAARNARRCRRIMRSAFIGIPFLRRVGRRRVFRIDVDSDADSHRGRAAARAVLGLERIGALDQRVVHALPEG